MNQPRFGSWAALLLLAGAGNYLFGQLVYVPNAYEQTISAFVINSDAGILTELLPRMTTAGFPTAAAADPHGKFLYVTSAGNTGFNVTVFGINAASGALHTPSPSSTYPVDGYPVAVCVDPSGRFLYVVTESTIGSDRALVAPQQFIGQFDGIVGFTVDAVTGTLTRMSGTPYATGITPSAIVVDPSGKFLYVTNQVSNNVSAYTINSSTGVLTAISGSPFAEGAGASGVTVDEGGKFLFVTNLATSKVHVYAMDHTTGGLTPAPGSPFATGTGPMGVVVDPTGRFAYVTNRESNNISAYRIDATTGALTEVTGSPFATPQVPVGAVIDTTGKFLYAADMVAGNISGFAIDSNSGSLNSVPGSPFATGNGPEHPVIAQLTPAVVPPVVARAALNAASYAVSGMPNYGVAQGSMFIAFGQNIGPAALQQANSFPLQAQLGGTSIKVTVGGVTTNAIMVYSYVTQVAAILPSSTPPGDGTFTITYNGSTSAAAPIHVVNGSVGIFTRNQAGSGPAIVQNFNSATDQPVNSVVESAHPGQTLILWATGLGPVTFDETQPPQARNLRNDVEVWVGNKRASISYAGRSPQFPGIDQINFILPTDVALGCYVPLAIQVGGPSPVTGNFSTIAITSQGKLCSDAHGLSSQAMTPLSTGGTLNLGWIQLLRLNLTATIPGLGSGTGLADTGWGSFFRWNGVTGLSDQGLDMFTGRGTSLGTCSVFTFVPPGQTYIPTRTRFLDAGKTLNVSGPKGSGSMVQTNGYYNAHKALGASSTVFLGTLPPPFLEPGTITVDDGSGGADVGKFKATVRIPASTAPLQWTNMAVISTAGIDRSQDLTITWTGGDPTSEYAVLAGTTLLPGIESNIQLAAAFVCSANFSAGQLTVPGAVLSALPASNTSDPTSGILLFGRAPLLNDSLRFSAIGLDVAYLTNAVFTGTQVVFR